MRAALNLRRMREAASLNLRRPRDFRSLPTRKTPGQGRNGAQFVSGVAH
jgi:hypothetical protein